MAIIEIIDDRLPKEASNVSTLMFRAVAIKETEIDKLTQTDSQTDRQADRQMDRETGRQADRWTDRQAGRQTDGQTDRQAGGLPH